MPGPITRYSVRTNARVDLNDIDTTNQQFTDPDINQAIQDAYNEIVARTQCILKKVTLNWADCPTGNYFDFLFDLGVADFMATVAIYNNNSKLWLRDDVSYRDLTRIRADWEIWRGQPNFWVPHSLRRTLIVPILESPTGTFDLWYWAFAPVLGDFDDQTPLLLPTDLNLPELYTVYDLLESVQEFGKAQNWNKEYLEELETYKTRVHNPARYNFLLRL